VVADIVWNPPVINPTVIGSIEAPWYGVYNAILGHWFPVEERYAVSPQWDPNPAQKKHKALDFAVLYRGRPILLIEIKPPHFITTDSARHLALQQIRSRIDVVCPTVTWAESLYAVSIIGKDWRALCCPAGRRCGMAIPFQLDAESSATSNARVCWTEDIFSSESYDKMQALVSLIKEGHTRETV
jgi:hypothetical protein